MSENIAESAERSTRYVKIKTPKRQLDWQGCRVRASHDFATGEHSIPKGRIGTVDYVSAGIAMITFDACSCCGVAPRLRWKRVNSPTLIEFVEPAMLGLGEVA